MKREMIKKITMWSAVLVTAVTINGCSIASINDWFSTGKEKLVGNQFVISSYDDYANKTMTIEGSKVSLGLLTNNANFDSNDSSSFKSEVLEITVNGSQVFGVGNTMIFAEKGLDMVTDFEPPTNINAVSGGSLTSIDRTLNGIKNSLGKSKTVVISSQQGVPIGVYQGENVYVTIPDNVPKTTRLNIDGKALYIHRANYTILDTELIK